MNTLTSTLLESKSMDRPSKSLGSTGAQSDADDDLRRRIVNCLHARGAVEDGNVEVEVLGGQVILHGRVPSPHAQWLCVECCRHVAGVIRLIDELEMDTLLHDGASAAAENDVNVSLPRQRATTD